MRELVAEKEAAILEFDDRLRILGEQKEQLALESIAQLEIIESQRLKLNQLEVDRDRDVLYAP